MSNSIKGRLIIIVAVNVKINCDSIIKCELSRYEHEKNKSKKN